MSAAIANTDLDAAPRPSIVAEVVRQHVEQAAFLWAQRHTLMMADPPDMVAVAGVDKRLEANLDGIRIAGFDACAVYFRCLPGLSAEG
ncbi:hypothetical protein ACVOMV_15470 [Mesorhizobium atlanticum]